MLWTIKDIEVLNRATEKTDNGKYVAKNDISKNDRERLESLDELNMIEYGEHLILNL